MSERCLLRNYHIAIRTELHFNKMHACWVIQCFNFDQLLYSHYKYTLTGKIHPTDHDSTAVKYLYTIYTHTVCLSSCGVSMQKRAYYEKRINMFYLWKIYYLSVLVFSYCWQMSSVNISLENDGCEWEEANSTACTFKTCFNHWKIFTAIKIVI